ncbi:hypothetical protein VPNG_03716 [Cytospora leucostoma]|uniref:Uncharacterized protein n=1 Tax=Cytospora leucostoma TaxID=1230097 RepID=A0A423XFH1_9PEZI|nr:hypothetical protein VPNG_03716 [Cytospora leucostoma]
MPRQAARLVLGRSARTTLPIRTRNFATTPRRHIDDDASKPTTRRERSVAAASALGAMSRPSEPTRNAAASQQTSSPVLDARSLGASRPRPASVVRPVSLGGSGGRPSNVINVRSLPRRADGDAPKLLFRRTGQDGKTFEGPPRPTGRFVRRTDGPGIARAPQQGGSSGRFQARPGGRGGAGGGMRGQPKRQARKPRSDNDKKKDEDERNNGGLAAMDEEVKAYVRQQEVGGVERPYTPSTTLESLLGWGPAVATNTALGQADIAVRNVRIMGGGRPLAEGEQSFKINEVKTWLARNKPIFFSSIEQKKAVMETLSHDKRDKVVQRNIDATVREIQKTTGNNWGAFVEGLKKWAAELPSTEHGKKIAESAGKHATPEALLKAFAQHKADANLAALAQTYKTQNTKTTREAIVKYALKGEHPEVKYAEDVYGKLAMYHAHGSTYRISDGEKFDEKMRKLIKVPVAGKAAAPKAQARP